MRNVNIDSQTRLNAGAKAAATKGTIGHQIAATKARITRLERTRDALTGYDKGLVTKQLNPLYAKLETLETGGTLEAAA